MSGEDTYLPNFGPDLWLHDGLQCPLQGTPFSGRFEARRVGVKVRPPTTRTTRSVDRHPAFGTAHDADQLSLPRLLPAGDAGPSRAPPALRATSP
jgi:hypothetical protein